MLGHNVRENTVLPRRQAAGSWEPSPLRLESSQPSTSNLHHTAHPTVLGRKGVHAKARWDSWTPGKNQEAARAQGTHLRNHHSAAKNRLQFHSSGLWWQKPSSNELNIPNGEFTGP